MDVHPMGERTRNVNQIVAAQTVCVCVIFISAFLHRSAVVAGTSFTGDALTQENSQPSAGGSRFDSHGHQFARTDRAMQTLLSENVFENTLMDDSSFTALLSLPSSEAANLLEQPSFCSETFAGDSLVGGWEQSCHFGPDSVNLSRETLATATTACLAIIPSDPGFVERAAKFSTFANGIGTEESAPAASGISSGGGNEAITGPGIVRPEESGKKLPKSAKENRFKKRKIAQSSGKPANSEQVEAKRWKSSNANHKNVKDDAIEDSEFQVEQKSGTNTNSAESIPKETENKKNSKAPAVVEKSNYIHVRARRGQATDSHSLAERVRREKISERMKLLQDLVPGCSKITGKAVMLDEIINHVQCLQRKVEFLSMKLAMVNPSRDFDLGHFFAEEVFTKNCFRIHGFFKDSHSIGLLLKNFPAKPDVRGFPENCVADDEYGSLQWKFIGFSGVDSTAVGLPSI